MPTLLTAFPSISTIRCYIQHPVFYFHSISFPWSCSPPLFTWNNTHLTHSKKKQTLFSAVFVQWRSSYRRVFDIQVPCNTLHNMFCIYNAISITIVLHRVVLPMGFNLFRICLAEMEKKRRYRYGEKKIISLISTSHIWGDCSCSYL